MTDELLPFYNRELAWFRRMAGEYSRAHPKIAARLRMSETAVEDPHVSRMIEAFAFLNARTRRKIDDDFPEIPQAMLQVLYPHYLAPFPSSAIIRMALGRDQADLVDGYPVERGAMLETEPVEGDALRFRTSYPVTLWPIEVRKASLQGFPAPAPPTPWTSRARSVIRIDLACYGTKVPVSQYRPGSLRFYLNAPPQTVIQLYESIFNNSAGVAITDGTDKGQPVLLGRESLAPVGFGKDESLFDLSPRAFPGYQLLTEYFVFPEKFLFFDLTGLDERTMGRLGGASGFSVFIFLDQHREELEQSVSTETFQIGCTPVVNLYPQRAEPIRLTQNQPVWRIVPDARRPLLHEIWSIDQVVALSPDNEQVEYSPFYSLRHHVGAGEEEGRFWHASRQAGAPGEGSDDKGTDMWLSLVDLQFDPAVRSEWTVDVTTTCLNRDLPARLPFGGGQPYMQLSDGGPLQRLVCLTAPTRTLRPAWGYGTLWRLISHLTLNHLSLFSPDDGPEPLREILRLYDLSDSEETRHMISGLLSVRARRVVGRPGAVVSGGFCRGLEVTLGFDEDKFTGGSVYLLASVLEHFLGLYASINSFTRTVVTTRRREGPLCQWPPRAGEMILS